jgi:hypothetical protein
MKRYLLELREADGRVMAEVFVNGDDAAGPTDDNGCSISYGQSIALFGRKWRLKTAETAATYVRITCVAAPMDSEADMAQNGRVEPEENSSPQPQSSSMKSSETRQPFS